MSVCLRTAARPSEVAPAFPRLSTLALPQSMPPSLLVLRGHVQCSDARRSPDFYIRPGPGEVDDHGDMAGLSGKVQSSTTRHLLSNVGVPWRRILS